MFSYIIYTKTCVLFVFNRRLFVSQGGELRETRRRRRNFTDMNNYSDVHYNYMTATAIARNGGGRSENGGVDVRVKLKSEKGSSPNTSMAGRERHVEREHDVIEPKFRRVVARNSQRCHRGERASLGGAVSRAEGRGTKERERRRVSHALFFAG